MRRSAAASSNRSATKPASSNSASSASSSAACRGGRPSWTANGHCESPASGSQASSRSRSRLRSRFACWAVSAEGRVQQATAQVSAASRGARRRARSPRRSSRSRPSRAPCLRCRSVAASTAKPASSGARSNTTCSAWPGSRKALLSRRFARPAKRSSSSVPIAERAPSRRNSETSEPSRQSSVSPPGAAAGSMKLSSGLRRSVQERARASSIARGMAAPTVWAGRWWRRRRRGRRCRRGR